MSYDGAQWVTTQSLYQMFGTIGAVIEVGSVTFGDCVIACGVATASSFPVDTVRHSLSADGACGVVGVRCPGKRGDLDVDTRYDTC